MNSSRSQRHPSPKAARVAIRSRRGGPPLFPRPAPRPAAGNLTDTTPLHGADRPAFGLEGSPVDDLATAS